jgi:hypothetical protein
MTGHRSTYAVRPTDAELPSCSDAWHGQVHRFAQHVELHGEQLSRRNAVESSIFWLMDPFTTIKKATQLFPLFKGQAIACLQSRCGLWGGHFPAYTPL